jgi:hypothetical protein
MQLKRIYVKVVKRDRRHVEREEKTFAVLVGNNGGKRSFAISRRR